jgi:hypothetical protein
LALAGKLYRWRCYAITLSKNTVVLAG